VSAAKAGIHHSKIARTAKCQDQTFEREATSAEACCELHTRKYDGGMLGGQGSCRKEHQQQHRQR